jgi:hypothetical protein
LTITPDAIQYRYLLVWPTMDEPGMRSHQPQREALHPAAYRRAKRKDAKLSTVQIALESPCETRGATKNGFLVV